MHAMVLDTPQRPLLLTDMLRPRTGPGEVLIGTDACAICRASLHVVDGELFWQERSICSAASLSRRDGEPFLDPAPRIPAHTTVQTFPLEAANEALHRLRAGQIRGAAVLIPHS